MAGTTNPADLGLAVWMIASADRPIGWEYGAAVVAAQSGSSGSTLELDLFNSPAVKGTEVPDYAAAAELAHFRPGMLWVTVPMGNEGSGIFQLVSYPTYDPNSDANAQMVTATDIGKPVTLGKPSPNKSPADQLWQAFPLNNAAPADSEPAPAKKSADKKSAAEPAPKPKPVVPPQYVLRCVGNGGALKRASTYPVPLATFSLETAAVPVAHETPYFYQFLRVAALPS